MADISQESGLPVDPRRQYLDMVGEPARNIMWWTARAAHAAGARSTDCRHQLLVLLTYDTDVRARLGMAGVDVDRLQAVLMKKVKGFPLKAPAPAREDLPHRHRDLSRAVYLGWRAAQRLGHAEIEPRDLMLGLLAERNPARLALIRALPDLGRLRASLEHDAFLPAQLPAESEPAPEPDPASGPDPTAEPDPASEPDPTAEPD